MAGEYPEHAHDDTELFVALAGRLHLDLPDRTVTLEPMDIFTVPRGMRHCPGTCILNIEPHGTTQDRTLHGQTGKQLD